MITVFMSLFLIGTLGTSVMKDASTQPTSMPLEVVLMPSGPWRLTIEFVNRSQGNIRVPARVLLLEDKFTWSPFVVMSGSMDIRYTGVMVRRDVENYVWLSPGSRIQHAINLRDYYAIGTVGKVQVKYAGAFQSEDGRMVVVDSNTIVVNAESDGAKGEHSEN